MNQTIYRIARFSFFFNMLVMFPVGWIGNVFAADAYPLLAVVSGNMRPLSSHLMLALAVLYLMIIAESMSGSSRLPSAE